MGKILKKYHANLENSLNNFGRIWVNLKNLGEILKMFEYFLQKLWRDLEKLVEF